jgi:hypothetical protein
MQKPPLGGLFGGRAASYFDAADAGAEVVDEAASGAADAAPDAAEAAGAGATGSASLPPPALAM